VAEPHFVEPTTHYWQALLPEIPEPLRAPPFRFGYPVRLPDGRVLVLPLRQLPDGDRAVASFLANHASHGVVEAIAAAMTELARPAGNTVVVGLPTLGLALAPLVAAGLGAPRFVPLGYSRKYWYVDALSEPVRSITSPDGGKRLFLDPNLTPLVRGREVILVDDAVSTGSTAVAVLRLLARAEVRVRAIVVAMCQTTRWQAALDALEPGLAAIVAGVFACPFFARVPDGWRPVDGTLPATALS
jgi:adenine/guanine phosphoribosyltransferase-like PRPP-binding protein